MVPVDSLETHPRNVNQGDIGAIYESIGANGFYGANRRAEKHGADTRR
jgi:hypothetical protein